MRSKEITNFILGVIGVTVIGAALYFILKYFFSFFSSFNTQTTTALLVVTIPVIASIITVYLGRSFEKQKTIQEKLRENKVPIYDEFITNVIAYLLDKDKDKNAIELAVFFQKMTPRMIIWADDEVLKAWADFRTVTTTTTDTMIMIKKFEDLMLAMRKDLGHSNKKLNNHEVLKCFINDIEEVFSKKKS